MKVLRRKLRRDLWARKGAVAALAAIVAVGVGVHVAMAAVYRDLDGARARYYEQARLVDVTVELERAPERVLEQVVALPEVRAARGRVQAKALIDVPGVDEPIGGVALSLPEQRAPVLNDVQLVRGGWFSGRSDREVLIDERFARARGLRPGDRIRVTLADAQHELLVVGTARSPEFVYVLPPDGGLVPDPGRFGVLWAPRSFLQRSCDQRGAYNQVLVATHATDRGSLEQVGEELEALLEPFGVTQVIPSHDQASVRFLADELAGLKVSATVVPTLFLGVAAAVLNVLLTRLVAQQRSVLGTLRALGVSAWGVTRHVLGLGWVLGGVGAALGVWLALGMQRGLLGVYREYYALPTIEPWVYPDLVARGVAISVVCAVVGAWRGARAAARLQPAEAMRPPPPEVGRRVWIERWGWVWGRLSFRGRMVARSIARNPFRSAVSVGAFALSTALLTVTLCNVDALDALMRHEFEDVAHQDLTVRLREWQGVEVAGGLASLPGVAFVEPQLGVGCSLRAGHRRRKVGVTGLPRGSRLYTPLDASGRAVPIPSEGLVLSEKLAELLGVGVGDTVELRPLLGERRRVRAPVVGLADTFLGLGAYAELGYLARLVGEERVANAWLVRLDGGADVRALTRELERRPQVVGVSARRRSLEQLQETFGESMGAMIGFMVVIAGVIAFGSVLNAALVALSEREREVGTLRVLGYTPWQVAGIFVGENAILGCVGVGVGLGLGVGLNLLVATAYSTELYRFPVVVRGGTVLWIVGIMLGILAATQAVVVRLVRRLDWLQSLKTKE